MRWLLVDFGASRIKSTTWDDDEDRLAAPASAPSLPDVARTPGRFEVDPAALAERFAALVAEAARSPGAPLAGVLVSSEMHGFLAVDARGRPLTRYVSWKDERALAPIGGVSSLALADERLGEAFRARAGLRLRAGLPFLNLLHLGREGSLAGDVTVLTLADWLATAAGEPEQAAHDTMLGGLGFLDVARRAIAPELVAFVEEHGGLRCSFREPTGAVVPAGWARAGGRRVPVYVGIGDHPCAVLGAGNRLGETASVNVGTGSQVAVPCDRPEARGCDLRTWIDGAWLRTITHIPAGRALATFVGLFAETLRRGGSQADPWSWLDAIDEDAIARATLEVDLAVFPSAWGFDGGGRIARIDEGGLGVDHVLASLLRRLVEQYAAALRALDPEGAARTLVLSGGIPLRVPALRGALARATGREVAPSAAVDETLAGLRVLAARAARA